jgi:hypothetical protein
MEAQVLRIRDAHPAWGARKIARCLEDDGITPPAISTVHGILRRYGRVKPPMRWRRPLGDEVLILRFAYAAG